MILTSKAELAGRVKLQISGGARGTIDYPWQDNMILDQGFVQLIVNTTHTAPVALMSFGVGSSSQPVQPTDTGLISPIAFTPSGAGVTHGWDAAGGYGWSRKTQSFARGAAAGNISELTTNYTTSNTSAMARALVRDTQGDPTTITVVSDEVLTITWEWRKWWTVQQSYEIEYLVDGVSRTTTVSYKQNLGTGSGALGNGGTAPMNSQLISSSGGVFVGEFKTTFTEDQGNPQVASCTSAGDGNSGATNYPSPFPRDNAYATFDPPIAKTDEFVLEIYHRIQLTRRAP